MFCGLLLCLGVLLQTPTPMVPTRANVTEATLRKYIAKSELPLFPRESAKRKTEGVAVTVIDVNAEGKVVAVSVLEAPDDRISQAVERSLRRWKFNAPTIGGRPVAIRGKLTFYFVFDDGKAVVRSPKPFR